MEDVNGTVLQFTLDGKRGDTDLSVSGQVSDKGSLMDNRLFWITVVTSIITERHGNRSRRLDGHVALYSIYTTDGGNERK